VLVVGGGLTITGSSICSFYAVVNGGLKLFELDFVTLYVFAIILILFLCVLGPWDRRSAGVAPVNLIKFMNVHEFPMNFWRNESPRELSSRRYLRR
jgi:hypothetical protein